MVKKSYFYVPYRGRCRRPRCTLTHSYYYSRLCRCVSQKGMTRDVSQDNAAWILPIDVEETIDF